MVSGEPASLERNPEVSASRGGGGGRMELAIANPRGEALAIRETLDQHIADNHGPFWEPAIQRLAKIAKVSNPFGQLVGVIMRTRVYCANLGCLPALADTGADPAEPRKPAGATLSRDCTLSPARPGYCASGNLQG